MQQTVTALTSPKSPSENLHCGSPPLYRRVCLLCHCSSSVCCKDDLDQPFDPTYSLDISSHVNRC